MAAEYLWTNSLTASSTLSLPNERETQGGLPTYSPPVASFESRCFRVRPSSWRIVPPRPLRELLTAFSSYLPQKLPSPQSASHAVFVFPSHRFEHRLPGLPLLRTSLNQASPPSLVTIVAFTFTHSWVSWVLAGTYAFFCQFASRVAAPCLPYQSTSLLSQGLRVPKVAPGIISFF